MRSARFLLLILTLLFVLHISSCAPQELAGLGFVSSDGTATGVSRPGSDQSAKIGKNQTARFVLTRPYGFETTRDVSIQGEGEGSIRITAYQDSARKNIISSGSFSIFKGIPVDFRLLIPAGAEIGVIEVAANEHSAFSITGLSSAEKFIGVRLDQGYCTVDSTTSIQFSPAGTVVSATLALPSDIDTSVVVGLKADGMVRFKPLNGTDSSNKGFEAITRVQSLLAIPVGALGKGSRVLFEAATGIASITLADGAGAPLSDLYTILASPVPDGDFSLYRWDIIPETLVFDFRDYDTQDLYLKRLAFFAEKPGFRGRLGSNEEIAPLHGWNAHDYSTLTLKSFFGMAMQSRFPLDPEELKLLDVLLQRGILIRSSDGSLAEGKGAIISIARESSAALRRLFIDHEASHALLFQDADYMKLSERLWNSLDSDSRWFWRLHFSWRHYDIKDEFLMWNEMQSYLVQQSQRAVSSYYENLFKRLSDAYPANKEKLEGMSERVITRAVADAGSLNDYLRTRWGVTGGNLGRVKIPITSD